MKTAVTADTRPIISGGTGTAAEKMAAFEAAGVPVARIAAPEEAGAVFAQALPILHRPLAVPVVPGKPSPAHAPAVIAAIEEWVEKSLQGATGGDATAVRASLDALLGLQI